MDNGIFKSGLVHQAKPEKAELLLLDAEPVGLDRNSPLTLVVSVIAKTPDVKTVFVGVFVAWNVLGGLLKHRTLVVEKHKYNASDDAD